MALRDMFKKQESVTLKSSLTDEKYICQWATDVPCGIYQDLSTNLSINVEQDTNFKERSYSEKSWRKQVGFTIKHGNASHTLLLVKIRPQEDRVGIHSGLDFHLDAEIKKAETLDIIRRACEKIAIVDKWINPHLVSPVSKWIAKHSGPQDSVAVDLSRKWLLEN
jgi:hypothetical protein